jgi:RecB family exonuclease
VTFIPKSPRRTWTEGAPSALAAHGEHAVRDALATDAEGLDRGAVLHAFLQRVGWIDDGLPDDRALAQVAKATLPGRSDEWIAERIARFRQFLGGEATCRALARPAGDVELWQERAFAVRVGAGLIRGRIDRLELYHSPRGLVRVLITDLKTDRIAADAAPARAALYRPQLAAYVEAVSVMLQIPIAQVSARLLFLEPDLLMDLV